MSGKVCFPSDVEAQSKEAEAKRIATLPEKVDLNVKHPEKLIEIDYDPLTVICRGCGRVYEAKSFEHRPETVEAIGNLEVRAADNDKINQLVKKFKAGELDYYTYCFELEKIKQKEDAKKIRSSNFSGEAEKECKCGSISKVKVNGKVVVDTAAYAPSFNDIRKAPFPNERVISHLLRTGKVLVSPEKWSEMTKLEQQIKEQKDAGKEDVQKSKELELKVKLAEEVSISRTYVLSLLEKPPELDCLTQETKEKFRAKGVPDDLLYHLDRALDIFKDAVSEEYSRRCATFFHAIERLAAQDAYNFAGGR